MTKPAEFILHATLAVVFALGLGGAPKADARTLRWSHQHDIASLDPMAADDGFTQGFQGWFYEALTGYDQDLKLVPMLAERWDNPEPSKWVFYLRAGVSFHDGSPFTADDVIFSWRRSLTPGSAIRHIGAKAVQVNKIDDHTIEVVTPVPNPILPRDWALLYIMSKPWAQRNRAGRVGEAKPGSSPYASRHENGTGPFRVTDRQPRARTVLKRYEGYWNPDIPGNVTQVVFQPIAKASERVAALVSGNMDIVMPVPPESLPSLENAADVRIMNAPEARVIFIGMDQHRKELLFSSVKGKNPFKDKRVRSAMGLAIDVQDINRRAMNGAGQAVGTIIADRINGYDPAFGAPYTSNVDQARKLLTDAGYPDGFSVRLACPEGLYADDTRVCAAIVQMLARIGIRVDVAVRDNMMPPARGLPRAVPDDSMYLLSWAPRNQDAAGALFALVSCRDSAAGAGWLNLGGYCNREIDALTARIEAEPDLARRNIMIKEAFAMLRNDYGYLPLLQPPMSWGVRKDIRLTQRANNVLDVRSIVMP